MGHRATVAAVVVALTVAVGIRAKDLAQDRPLPNLQGFLQETVKHLRSNDLIRSQYTFQEKEIRHSHDSTGRITKTVVRVYEVYPAPDPDLTYRRLVSLNGVRPADMEKKDADQRRAIQRWVTKRQQEGLNAREARLRKETEAEQAEQAVLDEILAIYDVHMLGRDVIDGRTALQLSLDPRLEYRPRTREGRIIKNFKGRLWIDEQDYELVRMRLVAAESVSVGLGFVARLYKGSRAEIERRKINGEAWLPTQSHFQASGRVLLIMRFDLDQLSEFTDYKKLTTDSTTPFSVPK